MVIYPRMSTRAPVPLSAPNRVIETQRATGRVDDPPAPGWLRSVQPAVDARLRALLESEQNRWEQQAGTGELFALLAEHVRSGGKRIRPSFFLAGYQGSGGCVHDPSALDLAAALELLHAFALLQDDVMDGSAWRRNRPALHRSMAETHTSEGWQGESRRFGEAMAVLAADLAFALADDLVCSCPPPVTAVWAEMRRELVLGQFLDLTGAAHGAVTVDDAMRIARYKSGSYTVERPLHLGASLTGRLEELGGAYSAFGIPLGQAFQLRDDLLGAFGNPAMTGKPDGDDLRQRKPTLLRALAERCGLGAQVEGLSGPGEPDPIRVMAIGQLLVERGVRDEVERTITGLHDQAMAALDEADITSDARAALRELAGWAVTRCS